MHYHDDGTVFIPPMQFKNCLSNAAKFISMKIPGQGKATYTKNFEAGVMVLEGIDLPTKKDDVLCEMNHVPSDGKRGGTTRVIKYFPLIKSWEGYVDFIVFDDLITKQVLNEHLNAAGMFIGIGRFRPRQNGYYGRFQVLSIEEL